MVLDGLRPGEINPELMPNLTALRAGGTWYEEARAVYVAETLPNHAAMMTGVLPERNGIVANDYWHPRIEPAQREKMQNPSLLGSDTLTTSLEESCTISTATVQSKEYLWRLFSAETPTPGDPNPQLQADYHWDPQSSPLYIGSPDDHAPDVATMNEGVFPWLTSGAPTPQFAFINLGDIDRSGHIDETGALTMGGTSAARNAAMRDTDTQLGNFVAELQSQGVWDETVLIITSDHGFDWSQPQNNIFVAQVLGNQGYNSPEELHTVPTPNGGAAMVYVRNDEDIAPIARILDAEPAVEFVATRESIADLGNPTLHEMGMDNENAGDVIVFLKPGWRVADESNIFIPGNHGHPVTQHSTLLVAGGHAVLRDTPASVPGELVYDPLVKPFSHPAGGPGNLSIAPTVAALFGIGPVAGGYDGPPLVEAFDHYAMAPHPPCRAATPADVGYPRPRGATPMRVALVPAFRQCTAPNTVHGPPLVFDSCGPPRRESSELTIGTPDANGRAATSVGSAQFNVLQSDVGVSVSVSDVRRASDLSDYTGEMRLEPVLRITDRHNGPTGTEPATGQDQSLPITVPCAGTTGATGATCAIATTVNAVVPGTVLEGKRAVWELDAVRLYDGGADGLAATAGDNELFARQGVFVP